jgi:capsular polysaccharide biosynthesis protein
VPLSAASYVHAWLDLLGIDPDHVTIYDSDADAIVADELLLPTVLHNGTRASPLLKDMARFLLQRIGQRHDLRTSPSGPRVFLSRRQVNPSCFLLNRDAIEKLALQARCTIVHPERLSLLDQVRLFYGAQSIIGEYGSALHGSIFSPIGTVVCALRGTRLHPGFIQSGIGEALDQPTGYLFGETIGTEKRFGFWVDEDICKMCFDLTISRRIL